MIHILRKVIPIRFEYPSRAITNGKEIKWMRYNIYKGHRRYYMRVKTWATTVFQWFRNSDTEFAFAYGT